MCAGQISSAARLNPVANHSALNRSIQIRTTVKLQKIPARYAAPYAAMQPNTYQDTKSGDLITQPLIIPAKTACVSLFCVDPSAKIYGLHLCHENPFARNIHGLTTIERPSNTAYAREFRLGNMVCQSISYVLYKTYHCVFFTGRQRVFYGEI